MKTTLKIFAVSLAVLLISVADLSAKQLGGQAGWFLRMGGAAADRIALGDAGVALVNNEQSWYYNPAGLAFAENRIVSLGYRSMSLDRSLMYAGMSIPIEPKAGVAFGILRAATANIDAYDSNGNMYDELSYSDNLIHGSFAIMPHPRFSMGVTIKWLISIVPDVKDDNKNLSSFGLSVDLGALVQPIDDLYFGLHIKDFDGRNTWESTDVWGDDSGAKEDKFPPQIRLGIGFTGIEQLTVAGDLVIMTEIVGNDDLGFQQHLGAEWSQPFSNDYSAAFRVGFNGTEPTFGFGLNWHTQSIEVHLSYAFLIDENSPNGAHMATWGFEF